ncbi:lysine--tRNA ligase [Pseudescherichia sp.]|uniref:lysine--tRNA ligase n=1 Tax=Pseudescherichia sp. TaxID=2055881 RepID=UPI0028A0217F|nr:lysine--tRNA ligase [Pseudescherichia sp.]
MSEERAVFEQELTSERDVRREKLAQLRKEGVAFPNDFRRNSTADCLCARYADCEAATLQAENVQVAIAGRVMSRRIMGKAAFLVLQDCGGKIQVYAAQSSLGEDLYQQHIKRCDLGDIIGVEGTLFKTQTGELTLHASRIAPLTKALRPLPDKFHGLADREMRYRQRYLDLIVNDGARRTFITRSKILSAIRTFMQARSFLEVETPMMQTLPGGASARPFITHHHALDQQMYLRISPELYLKRLVVGGFEKVFEINRNFRNEGISVRHNPEFTMMEMYEAYADYNDLIAFTEALFRHVAETVLGTTTVQYGDWTFDFAQPFARLTMTEAILRYGDGLVPADLATPDAALRLADRLGITVEAGWGYGRVITELFDAVAEKQLIQPTFITEYPAEVSPLARRNDANPDITDRFEFFIGGREIGNGFSELNDAEDQAERFREQVVAKEAGDEEAMFYDEDYVTALEHGLPPTAGLGIGIDRMVMLFTNAASIRDVILFPALRPIK